MCCYYDSNQLISLPWYSYTMAIVYTIHTSQPIIALQLNLSINANHTCTIFLLLIEGLCQQDKGNGEIIVKEQRDHFALDEG